MSGTEAREYAHDDKPVHCQFCGEKEFFSREGQLNTSTMTFFGLDWLNREATCLVCASCGYVHWFLLPPKR